MRQFASLNFGVTQDRSIGLHHDPIEDDGDHCSLNQALSVELGCVPDDVVGVPFARLADRVHQRWVLAVDRTNSTVGVSGILIVIENLHLVPVVEKEDTAISPLWPLPSISVGEANSK